MLVRLNYQGRAVADAAKLGAKGGKARAKNLSSARLREIALMGVEARREKMHGPLPQATHGDPDHPLVIGGTEVPCYVLEDGTRVLTQAGFLEALGRHRKANVRREGGEEQTPAILQGLALKPFIPEDLLEKSRPLAFSTSDGGRNNGYRAEILPAVCEVYLQARDAGALPHNQQHVAKQAEILIRALAHVGIIALVDEATGYQYDRPRRDLEEQLKKFISESLRRWVSTFPNDYFKHLCRLRGVELRPDMRLPQYFGHLTNNLVYRRLAPGLVKRLKAARVEKGGPGNKLHSWLSADIGYPEVLVHLGQVIGTMKQHTDYDSFERALDRIAPPYADTPGLFDDPKDWEER